MHHSLEGCRRVSSIVLVIMSSASRRGSRQTGSRLYVSRRDPVSNVVSGSDEPSQRCSGSGTKQSVNCALTVPDMRATSQPPGILARPKGTCDLTRPPSQLALIGSNTSMILPSFCEEHVLSHIVTPLNNVVKLHG